MNTILGLSHGMDVLPIVMELFNQEELWGVFSTPNHIPLRGETPIGMQNYVAFDMLPHIRPIVFGLMARVEGEELLSIGVWKVAPGETLTFPATPLAQRYIIGLQSFGGVVLSSLSAEVGLEPGSCWQTRGFVELEVKNGSGFPAVLLSVEIVPHGPATFVPEVPNANLPA